MASTAEERSTAAQIAALTRWAKTDDRSAGTKNARQKWRENLAREVDPDRVMPAAEVVRRARRDWPLLLVV